MFRGTSVTFVRAGIFLHGTSLFLSNARGKIPNRRNDVPIAKTVVNVTPSNKKTLTYYSILSTFFQVHATDYNNNDTSPHLSLLKHDISPCSWIISGSNHFEFANESNVDFIIQKTKSHRNAIENIELILNWFFAASTDIVLMLSSYCFQLIYSCYN